MIHSNSPMVTTGYANQTRQLALRLKAAGHDVAVSCIYGHAGGVLRWNGIPLYPCGADKFSNDVMLDHARTHFGKISNGLIITLVDVWVLDAAKIAQANVVAWTPVDHAPVPDRVVEWFGKSRARPVAMSRFGQNELIRAGLDVDYAPHGIETQVYKPVKESANFCTDGPETNEYLPGDQAAARRKLDLQKDAFVIGVVAANKGQPSRKCIPEILSAFAKYYEKNPKAVLYLHTDTKGVAGGVDIERLTQQLKLPRGSVATCDSYKYYLGYPDEYMVTAYQAMDVLLNTSMGEGFGLPIIEAQACGVPVIVTDWTAMPELCGAGWKVSGQKFYTPQQSWQMMPDIDEIGHALEKAYQTRGAHRARAREFAMMYDADRVFDAFWRPILARQLL